MRRQQLPDILVERVAGIGTVDTQGGNARFGAGKDDFIDDFIHDD
jgi:hypothetical protein